MQQGDARPDHQLGARQAHGQVAEVLDAEGRGELAVVHGQADFFVSLAAGDLVWHGVSISVSSGNGERDKEVICSQGDSSRLSALPPGRAACPVDQGQHQ
jgi:hypothetical protein